MKDLSELLENYRIVRLVDASEPDTLYSLILLNNKHSVKEFQDEMRKSFKRHEKEIYQNGDDCEYVLGDIDSSFDWLEIPFDDDYLTI